MKVIYAVPIELDTPGGNVQHVLGICRHAAKNGVDLHLICLRGQGTIPAEAFKITAIPSEGLNALRRIRRFCQRALEIIEASNDASWIYFRPFPLDYYLFTRHILKRNLRYAYELNTLWAEELRSQKKPIKALVYPWLESLSLRKANALLPVTQEIANHARSVGGAKVPYLVAGNGIEIPSTPSQTLQELRAKWNLPSSMKLVIMAGFSRPWHGYEKLLAALSELPPLWHVVLVGSESSDVTSKVQQQAEDLGLKGRVHVLPWLTHTDVDEVVYACDVGVSPLALEVKKMKEAQSLKVRHYLAMGLPVLIAGGETESITKQPFVHMLDNTSPKAISQGIQALGESRDIATIQSFAKTYLSWEAVAKNTFQFLKTLS